MKRISLSDCNCFSVRKAARHLTQAYDAILAPSGIRSTQYMILAALCEREKLSVNELASVMIMNRTTMGRNLRPLERDGLILLKISSIDRRSREITLTAKGRETLDRSYLLWKTANATFQERNGKRFSENLRVMHAKVVNTPLT